MKHIIYFIFALFVCGVYAGCSENEIELYNQTPRVNFVATWNMRSFVDTDYVKKTPYITDSFVVRIQGDFLKEQRAFCLKSIPNSNYEKSVEIVLDDTYTYTALDTVCQTFYYKINRPEVKSGKKVYGCFLEFDLDNPRHQFDKGLVEKNRMDLNVRWNLKPENWEEWIWKEYSDAKYMFMMDVCECTLKDMQDDDYDKVVEAYKNYKDAGNPPILDEKGDEISFE
ncbi:hypothetical protein IX307_000859 [Bacteroides pyogenes]|uniref:DUF4843 domain-containing protein n=1 Tax=Bacteroides pyogenes TaxID=310300 RepID=A0A5D3EWM0_9BACE|nr:DUF4843 domain-containing protein [Bacteroides pyogenes]MBR8707535.1 hypothetical protein [Bacteroides pyogenes]MBR8716269.1 hypothetical protein [Bacteroides pyogenes]MBR8719608.1 hypothetical protein [Bacteroides pyogenes]MBR8726130.1 hypothetical protein [Bacteroides pyogenes]MBR8739433.1 hypothetical protein [Bacteroides pyogenes]